MPSTFWYQSIDAFKSRAQYEVRKATGFDLFIGADGSAHGNLLLVCANCTAVGIYMSAGRKPGLDRSEVHDVGAGNHSGILPAI